jgi:hypothetical protein
VVDEPVGGAAGLVLVPVGGAAGLVPVPVLVLVLEEPPGAVGGLCEPDTEPELEAEALLVWCAPEPQPPTISASPTAAVRIGPAGGRRLIAGSSLRPAGRR